VIYALAGSLSVPTFLINLILWADPLSQATPAKSLWVRSDTVALRSEPGSLP